MAESITNIMTLASNNPLTTGGIFIFNVSSYLKTNLKLYLVLIAGFMNFHDNGVSVIFLTNTIKPAYQLQNYVFLPYFKHF